MCVSAKHRSKFVLGDSPENGSVSIFYMYSEGTTDLDGIDVTSSLNSVVVCPLLSMIDCTSRSRIFHYVEKSPLPVKGCKI
jgi:hypothetical protein